MATKVSGPNGMFKLQNNGMSMVQSRYRLITGFILHHEENSSVDAESINTSNHLTNYRSDKLWTQNNTLTGENKFAYAIYEFPEEVTVAYVEIDYETTTKPDKIYVAFSTSASELTTNNVQALGSSAPYLTNIELNTVSPYKSPINIRTGVKFIRIAMVKESADVSTVAPSLKNLKVYVTN